MNTTPQEIRRIFDEYDKILLTVHVSPDGDAIGTLLALYEWLQRQGKTVVAVIDDTIDDTFSFLQGAAEIKKPDAVTVDASWLTVVLDATAKSRTGAVETLMQGKVLNLDHHISNEHFADWEYIRTDHAAAGEVLTSLFQSWRTEITPTMATALYLAIATDCGFFKFGNTTGHTLRTAAALVDAGALPNVISEHLDACPWQKIRALSEVLNKVELLGGKRIACIAFTPELLQYTGEHTGGYIDYARNISGVDVAFTVKYERPEETRVSLRSKTVDVNAIAAVFGGGGHVRAAGCTLFASLAAAKKMIAAEIMKAL
ncbi:DHH family phosphoesterase [Megasphaera vaginalis (ex Bordigoni et al. 2020)]|uniref:DHH family phosphoesterase n=1 Tax=Megasphaera vaginalis (ex Bordigoni et al. 2020) TaxID=2045301 RepID=UPI000C7DCBC5|nr:bifunctional oligoribonuclease/PAP phosphatase NrnA [Megasphaera vaginalis (ex Bordigoni et al. 2020)]